MKLQAQAGKWSDLGIRTASSLALIPLVLADIWFGGIWLVMLATLLGVVMAFEWASIVNASDPLQFTLMAASALVAGVLPGNVAIIFILACIAGLALLSLWRSSMHEKRSRWSGIGPLYVGLPILALVVLRQDPAFGLEAIMWIIGIVWAADIMAYFAGRAIGGPKLAPVLSPKKTWAGLGGAVFGAALASLVFGAYAMGSVVWPLVILGGVFAVIEQGGDILESMLKRQHGVKDSGRLIPGHGGIIDRVDGLVAVAVAALTVGLLRNSSAPATGLLIW